jgi:cell division ATPase FtsA
MEEQEAEKLKLEYGNALFDHEAEVERPETVQSEDNHTTVTLRELNDVIEARAEEIAANVLNQIELSGYAGKLLSGIVITGGGSNLRNIDELIRRKSKTEKIRVASAPHYDVRSPEYTDLKDGTLNMLFGLLASGTENCCRPKAEEPKVLSDKPSDNSADGKIPDGPIPPVKGPKQKGKGRISLAISQFVDDLFSDEDLK